jgi:hypothetical protein
MMMQLHTMHAHGQHGKHCATKHLGKENKKKITLAMHNKSMMRRYNVEWTIKLVESESNCCTTMPS